MFLQIWYHNVPHTLLAQVKGHQNWVKVSGEFLTFPGGGTQFIHGALHYIDYIQEVVLFTSINVNPELLTKLASFKDTNLGRNIHIFCQLTLLKSTYYF